MKGDILQAARIADALLQGPWDLSSLTGRLKSICSAEPKQRWPRQTAVEILARYPSAPDRSIDLAFWIQTHRHLSGRLNDVHWPSLPRPVMRPHPAAAGLPIPALCTPGDVAAWLHRTPEQVDGLAGIPVPERHRRGAACNYRYRCLKKSNGRLRLIESPKLRLKSVQRQILTEILDHVPPHPAAHAFVRGRSVQTFLAPHTGRNWVLRFDLADFFSTISAVRVVEVFRFLGYPEAVVRMLARLSVNAPPETILSQVVGPNADSHAQQLRRRLGSPHLPQGAPTSPALANFAMHRLDSRIAGLTKSRSVVYTRYCDDLVLSGERDSRRNVVDLRRTVLMILADEGLSIRHCKTRFMPAGMRQNVCGLNLNQRLNTPRASYDQLRAILHRCATRGFDASEREDLTRFQQHLRGRIAYVGAMNPARQRKLMKLFDSILWQ